MSSYSLREATTTARTVLRDKAGSTMSKLYPRFFKEQVIPYECKCGECSAVLCIYSYRGRSYSHIEPFCRRCGGMTQDIGLRGNIPDNHPTYEPDKLTVQTFVEANNKMEEESLTPSLDELFLSMQRKLNML